MPRRSTSTSCGDKAKVPWHFKLMVVALVIYLGWRFVQLIGLFV